MWHSVNKMRNECLVLFLLFSYFQLWNKWMLFSQSSTTHNANTLTLHSHDGSIRCYSTIWRRSISSLLRSWHNWQRTCVGGRETCHGHELFGRYGKLNLACKKSKYIYRYHFQNWCMMEEKNWKLWWQIILDIPHCIGLLKRYLVLYQRWLIEVGGKELLMVHNQ